MKSKTFSRHFKQEEEIQDLKKAVEQMPINEEEKVRQLASEIMKKMGSAGG